MTTITSFKPLTKDDVAAVLGVSLRTIENWVNDRTLPAPRRLGNRVYWHPAVFYGWLEHQLTAEEAPVMTCEPPAEKAPKVERQSKRKSLLPEVNILQSRDQAKIDELLA